MIVLQKDKSPRVIAVEVHFSEIDNSIHLKCGKYELELAYSRDGSVFGALPLGGMPALIHGQTIQEAAQRFATAVTEFEEGRAMIYSCPDHPIIRNMENTGYPDGKLPKFTCPFCGAAHSVVYTDWSGDAVGCEHCVEPYDVEDFYCEDNTND